MKPDAVIIGAGMSGLTAAVGLAEAGASVLVVAKGAGSLPLAPATIDLLGYAAGRVSNPLQEIAALVEREPGHPYALVGPDAVGDATEWLRARVEDGPLHPYRYLGSAEQNMLLPTALGVPRPSALVPETMAAGDLRHATRMLVVGVRGMKDFHPALVADNLGRSLGDQVVARATQIDPPDLGRAPGTLALARWLGRPGSAEALAGRLVGLAREDEVLALPALLSLANPHGVWQTLTDRLQRPVCEIPTLPPSVPGLRLFETLKSRLRQAGGRLITGAQAVGVGTSGPRVDGVRVRVAGGERVHSTRWVVLATGGVTAGGLELGADWRMRETVLGLDVAHVPAPGEARFSARYLDSHPLGPAGIVADGELRPLRSDGERQFENVLVVGASLGGAEPWRQKCGEGIALATGHRAAELILVAEGRAPLVTRAAMPGAIA